MYLHLHGYLMRITVGDSDLCCCTCVSISSADELTCVLIQLLGVRNILRVKPNRPHPFSSTYIFFFFRNAAMRRHSIGNKNDCSSHVFLPCAVRKRESFPVFYS